MLFGLIASTGLRVSEALALRLDDILHDGVLHIRQTKFRKSRLVPLHATASRHSNAILTRDANLQARAIGSSHPSSTDSFTHRR
jgi:integrase